MAIEDQARAYLKSANDFGARIDVEAVLASSLEMALAAARDAGSDGAALDVFFLELDRASGIVGDDLSALFREMSDERVLLDTIAATSPLPAPGR
jgi:hypothetical protein